MLLPCAVALVLGIAACASDGDVRAELDRASFTATMQTRFSVDPDRAACITDYIFEDYGPDEIAVLADDGMAALPQVRWGPYLDASAACLTHDEPLPGVP